MDVRRRPLRGKALLVAGAGAALCSGTVGVLALGPAGSEQTIEIPPVGNLMPPPMVVAVCLPTEPPEATVWIAEQPALRGCILTESVNPTYEVRVESPGFVSHNARVAVDTGSRTSLNCPGDPACAERLGREELKVTLAKVALVPESNASPSPTASARRKK